METTSMPSISNEEEFPWKTPETTFRHAADTREVKVPGFFSHYKLLLWKTFVLRKRQPWVIVSELVLPIILVIVVVALRFTKMPEVYPPCYLVSQPLPSMGFLAYMRSIVCNFNFSCSSHDVDDQSRANLFPSWMQLIAKQPPQMLDSALNLISSLAMEDEKESTDPVVTLIDILCKPEVAVLLRSSPHSDRVYYLEKLCKAPNFIKVLSLTTVVEEVAQSLGTLVPDKKALRQNSGTQGLNVSLLVEQ
ncbi:unnamed protein product, partial [Mesocestoides corti]|uniref:Pannexin_like domain-containing protein n=1 Tax=Mesocestoides corti TaxID=53468 RepID=A0A0R3U9F4_MESCO